MADKPGSLVTHVPVFKFWQLPLFIRWLQLKISCSSNSATFSLFVCFVLAEHSQLLESAVVQWATHQTSLFKSSYSHRNHYKDWKYWVSRSSTHQSSPLFLGKSSGSVEMSGLCFITRFNDTAYKGRLQQTIPRANGCSWKSVADWSQWGMKVPLQPPLSSSQDPTIVIKFVVQLYHVVSRPRGQRRAYHHHLDHWRIAGSSAILTSSGP